MHRIVSFMVLSDLSLETHLVEEVKCALHIARLFDIVQVIVVVSCGSITALSAAPSVRSTRQLEAISWASARLGLPERPIPVTRFALKHLRLENFSCPPHLQANYRRHCSADHRTAQRPP
jgi:hypothetical protein